MTSLTSLFKPQSVALIGASNDTRKYGYWTAKSMIDNHFPGNLYMVSRTKADTILGYTPYASVLDIKGHIDLAVVAIAPRFILDVIKECVQKDVKSMIIVSTGFGETGEKGKALEKEILKMARENDMRIMGPNCMGMFSSEVSLNASIIDLDHGPLSLVLQSGNFGIDINCNARARKLGYSCWATIGNQMDLRFHDYVNYIRTDAKTKALMLYMEGLRVDSEADGRRFLETARKTTLNTPIAAIKIGKSSAGARAAASHTGSLAGSEAVFDAALQQAGIFRVETPAELLDVAEAFTRCTPARGNRIGILTDGGGHGVMATDLAEGFGLQVPVLSENTQAKLREILLPHCPIRNPVDLAGTPEADMWVFDRCAEVILEDDDIDGIIIVGLYGGYADLSDEFKTLELEVAQSLVKRIQASKKPAVMHSIYHHQNPEALQLISEGGIPVYGGIDSAIRAMGAVVSYQNRKKGLQQEMKTPEIILPENRKPLVEKIIQNVRRTSRINLVETEARDILSAYGFEMPGHYLATSGEDAAACFKKVADCSGGMNRDEHCDGNMVMKIVSPDILHKTDANGVLLNIDSPRAAKEAYELLIKNGRAYNPDADIFGVMMSPMLPLGVECIIGSTWDTTFGPTVMFGLGGIFVEVLKDVAFRVAPVKTPEATKMIREIKGSPILDGVRGAKGVDQNALIEAVCRLSQMVAELNDIAEVDMNPVFAMEKGIAVVDARIVLHPL